MKVGFLIALATAFVVSYVSCLIVRRWAPRLGLVDKPGYRKIHDAPVPTGGGLAIWLAVILPLLLAWFVLFFHVDLLTESLPGAAGLLPAGLASGLSELGNFVATHRDGFLWQSGRLGLLLGLGTILVVLGTLDDRYGLGWKIRLLVQFLVASAAVALGWRATCFLDVPWLTGLLSVFWIVGLINSFNMMDNMDGLAAGVASICACFLAFVLLVCSRNADSGSPQYFMAGLLLILVGALWGFLVHNRPPARLFMGDGGAYFIGFLLATTTLSATFVGRGTAPQAIFVPLCILAVPLYDLTSVVLIRLSNKKSPFEGDKNHYSHRLVKLGLTRVQAVLTIYLTTIITCLSALFLYQVSWGNSLLVLLQMILVLALVCILEFSQRRNGKSP
ncbi:MAG: MraY family glycosyltransferase [Planctomycetia bacterium]|nr:MraY family glycosyltransferase [Planctomycetia bacterium]